MDRTSELPPLTAFYSSISEKSITRKEHIFAGQVWKKFGIKNLSEYALLYCRIDTLLLAEIFEKFRSTMMDFAGLDAAHYISLPGFGWDTMLKVTGCEIGLPTDLALTHFVEKAIRGGLCFINTRHAKVEEDDESSKIIYYDAVNLYGYSQTGLLPYNSFEWMSEEDLEKFDLDSIDTNGDYGYILEVDLIYPKKLHHLHNDYPLAPHQGFVGYQDLSPNSKAACTSSTGKMKYESRKLLSTLENKLKYVVHIKNLVLYTKLGMICSKIHRIMRFRQKAFLKPFIDKCTLARKNAASTFDNSLFKKISNSCYGKTIECVRDYTTIKVHYNAKSLQRATSHFTFKHFSIVGENIVTTTHFPNKILFNKPYAVGFTILELSKHFMYDFYYQKLLKSCGRENVTLLMTDTDSFILHVKNKECLSKLKPYMDYSNYPLDHPLYDITRKSQLGCFKDEIHPSKNIQEFVGLRAKCYALRIKTGPTGQIEDKKVCKGLGRVCIQNRLKFSQYKHCLFHQRDILHHFTSINSKKHTLYTCVKNKRALSVFDSKRYILSCGIHSVPYGSFYISQFKDKCNICANISAVNLLLPEQYYHNIL